MSLTFFTQTPSDKQFSLIEYEPATRTKQLLKVIAHGLVYLLRTEKIQRDTLRSLLEQHAKYYPRQLPQHIQKLSAHEQIEYLLVYTQPHAETLVPSLAYTIQQMAVDSICKSPELYGNLLLDGHRIEELRKLSNLDNSGVIQAIADEVLFINIFVERYPDDYLLPVKEYYLCDNGSTANLFIHYQDHYYTTQSDIEGEE